MTENRVNVGRPVASVHLTEWEMDALCRLVRDEISQSKARVAQAADVQEQSDKQQEYRSITQLFEKLTNPQEPRV